MRAINSYYGRLIFLVLLTFCFCSTSVSGQEEHKNPGRGFQSGSSYSISEIESINTTNGNLSLNIPLVSLPKGRGEIGQSISLRYSSKLYDTTVAELNDISGQPKDQNILVESPDGGWKYSTNTYQLELKNRFGVGPVYDCTTPEEAGKRHFVWKLQMKMPDGSRREFRPAGYFDQYNDGYFDVNPNGYLNRSCSSGGPTMVLSTSAGMTYYSIDGSYARLTFSHVPGSQNLGVDNPWVMSMPDGSRVTGGGGFAVRIYDRNGNYLDGTTDVFGRGISINSISGDTDHVVMSGFGGATLTYIVKWKYITVSKGYMTTAANSGRGRGGTSSQNVLQNMRVVERITFPWQTGGLYYEFNYNTDGGPSNGWGEISRITLPSGAYVDYSYTTPTSVDTGHVLQNYPSQKTLHYTSVYDGVSVPIVETTTYAIGSTESTITGPDGTVTHEYHGDSSYENFESGLVKKITYSNGNLTEKIYDYNRPPGANLTANINSYVKTEFNTIADANGTPSLTAIKKFLLDPNGNQIEVEEYDFVPFSTVPRDGFGNPTGVLPAIAVLKRKSVSTFNNSASSNTNNAYWQASAPNVRNAVYSAELRDGNNIVVSRTEFAYDNSATTANLTQTRLWDSTKGAVSNPLVTGPSGNAISTSATYNSFGMPLTTTDSNGIVTSNTYGNVSGFYDLYPTQTTTAWRTWSASYDFYTGLVTIATDVDNGVSTVMEYDNLGRETKVRSAANTALESWSTTAYDDVQRRVIKKSDFQTTGDGRQVSIQHFDQLGRVRLSRTLESPLTEDPTNELHGIKVQTRYQVGNPYSYQLTSNPYRAAYSWNEYTSTMGWTRTKTLNTGRYSETETFSGSALPSPWGGNSASTGTVATDSNANVTTVTDQAGRQRQSTTNGIGQLTQVNEPDNNNQLTVATYYSYNAQGNITAVVQGTQTRTFSYSSLSRLLSALNPESGLVSYQYDANGNLEVKTDSRNVSTHFSYDSLNRVTRRWHNGSSASSATVHRSPALPPGVGTTYEAKLTYDTGSFGKGRLAYTTMGYQNGTKYRLVSNYEYLNRDQLGRPQLFRQSVGDDINGLASYFEVAYQYNLSGSVTSLTYPSGRVVNYGYDSVGRVISIDGNLGDGVSRVYSDSIQYAPFGGIQMERFGTATPLYHSQQFNSRGHLFDIRLGSWPWGNDRGLIKNYYSNGNGADNNGNIVRQEQIIPVSGGSVFRQQEYEYDPLNRIKSVTEGSVYRQAFTYDRYGNRSIDAANTFNAPAPQIDTSPLGVSVTNRVYSPSENISLPCASPQSTSRLMCYDAAGNLIRDKHVTNAALMTYDADGKMSTHNVSNLLDDTRFYLYDVDGKRNQILGGDVKPTYFVYGLGGELLYDKATAAGSHEYIYRNGDLLASAKIPRAGQSSDVRWLVKDHLGTPRMIADQTGSLSAIQRHDYLPFGEEIGVGVGGRDASQGYGPPQSDGIRQQFTGYERDQESGLDYAQARYFGSSLGRFTAVDPLATSASPGSPQSWNRYSYVENKPLRMVDPTGMIGDYYYEDGRYIGSDGKSDGRKYTATVDKRDITPDGEIIYVSNVREQRSVEAMAIQALSRSLGATADAAIFGKLKGAANFAINNTFPGAAGLLPNVPYDNEAEASHGAATQTGLGLGTAFATGVLVGGASLSAVPKIARPNGSFYSVAYETTLPETLIGKGYSSHFKFANTSLSEAMASDATFANALKVNIPRSSKGTILGESPSNWVWHHDIGRGKLQLVPSSQHRSGSSFWLTLHPEGRGGMALWNHKK